VFELSAPQYLFLPIKPQWAVAILEGTKKWELRTQRPSIDAGDVVVLYASSPLRAVVGSFIAGEVVSGTPQAVWNSVRGEIASTRASYFEAFGNTPVLHAIQVKRPRRIDPYTPPFTVGQGWRFLDSRTNSSHRSVIRRIKDSR
jgi:predicted transcriptional regulator